MTMQCYQHHTPIITKEDCRISNRAETGSVSICRNCCVCSVVMRDEIGIDERLASKLATSSDVETCRHDGQDDLLSDFCRSTSVIEKDNNSVARHVVIDKKIDELSKPHTRWKPWHQDELWDLPVSRINSILECLRAKIEEVSSELVKLLQKRDRQLQEIDIRNIAIEQLVKILEKMQLRLTYPLAVQMNVILPKIEIDDISFQQAQSSKEI